MSKLITLLLAAIAIGMVAWVALRGDETPGGGSSGTNPPAAGGPEDPEPDLGPSRALDVPDGPTVPEPSGPPPSLSEARSLFESDRPEDAVRELDRLLALEPENTEARLLRARSYLRLGVTWQRQAAADLRAVLEQEESPEVLVELGEVTLQTATADAVKYLERAIELNPRLARPHSLIASVHLRKGNLAAARDAVERAIAIDPREPLANSLLDRLPDR